MFAAPQFFPTVYIILPGGTNKLGMYISDSHNKSKKFVFFSAVKTVMTNYLHNILLAEMFICGQASFHQQRWRRIRHAVKPKEIRRISP